MVAAGIPHPIDCKQKMILKTFNYILLIICIVILFTITVYIPWGRYTIFGVLLWSFAGINSLLFILKKNINVLKTTNKLTLTIFIIFSILSVVIFNPKEALFIGACIPILIANQMHG